ncbi:MAG TPA: sigma factor-like helix-turn-helix DNA-binding protein, partial [Tissierellaceae bacterium]|nr:sigma factor-like helix-turn-helix DNA-binding protein [Tissierellaceae bacterium]
TLMPREQSILEMRYGLNGYEPHTLEEIGLKYDLTRERIRQIQERALRKLRHPSKGKYLEEFLYKK